MFDLGGDWGTSWLSRPPEVSASSSGPQPRAATFTRGDSIVVLQFDVAWELQALLRFSGIPYIVENSRFPGCGSTGPYPALSDGDFMVPAAFAAAHIAQRHVDIDSWLSPAQHADVVAFASVVSEQLAPLRQVIRWAGDQGSVQDTVLPRLNKALPRGLRHATAWFQHRKAAQTAQRSALAGLKMQQLLKRARALYRALDDRLASVASHSGDVGASAGSGGGGSGGGSGGPSGSGQSRQAAVQVREADAAGRAEGGAYEEGAAASDAACYFFGDKPSSLDALVFGHVAEALTDKELVAVLPEYRHLMMHYRLIVSRYFTGGIFDYNVSHPAGGVSAIDLRSFLRHADAANLQNPFNQLRGTSICAEAEEGPREPYRREIPPTPAGFAQQTGATRTGAGSSGGDAESDDGSGGITDRGNATWLTVVGSIVVGYLVTRALGSFMVLVDDAPDENESEDEESEEGASGGDEIGSSREAEDLEEEEEDAADEESDADSTDE